jgi:hypothetical protein
LPFLRYYEQNGRGKPFNADDTDNISFIKLTSSSGVNTATISQDNFTIFPNPASGELQIIGAQSGEVHLFDLLGREVLHGMIPENGSLTLDVSFLPSGLYFVNDGITQAKFVKE